MTIRVSLSQRQMLNALRLHGICGMSDLDLCNKLRGPVREPTVDALLRMDLIHDVSEQFQSRRLALTAKGRAFIGAPDE